MPRKEFGQSDRPKLIGRLSEDNLFYSESGELIGTYKITKEWETTLIHCKDKFLVNKIEVYLENGQKYNAILSKGDTRFISREDKKD